MKIKIKPYKVVVGLLLLAVTILWAAPLVWAVFTSFKPESEIKGAEFHFLPQTWVLENYINVLTNTGNTPVVRWFLNSLLMSSVTCVLTIAIVSMAAYGYTRLKFKAQDTLFYTIMAISLFPSIVNIIPLFKIVSVFGWVNTNWAIIVPALGGVTNIFLVRQFLLGVPKEFDEAAKIDGAGEVQIYLKIILPILRPILTVIGLFTFTAVWNDLLWPTIVFNNVQKMPLTPGLQLLMGAYGNFFLGAIMTGAIIAIVPTFVLYLFAQKYFLQSLSLSSGVKG